MASTHLSTSLQSRKQAAWRATVALVGMVYFVAIIGALHLVRPDLNPISQPTSQYAVGPYGWLMTSAFFSMSVASFALVLGLAHAVSQPARSRIGLALLGLWGVGVLIAMVFPLNPVGTPPTLSSIIHRINGPFAFLSLTAGVIVVSRCLKRDETWRPLHRPALILSLIMLAAFIAIMLNIATEAGFVGFAQRTYLAAFATWFLLTAARLRSVALGTVSA